jgi:hypothetical protein
VRANGRIYTSPSFIQKIAGKIFEIAKKKQAFFFKELETPVHAPNAVPKIPALSRFGFY